MPYDAEGRFIYDLPKRKPAPRKPKPKPAAAPSVSVALTPEPVTAAPIATIPLPEPIVEIMPPAERAPHLRVVKPHPAKVDISDISEIELAALWNWQTWTDDLRLTTTDGRRLEIIYRGRWSGGLGPDFKGAVLAIDGQIMRGDVELHLKAGDWHAHGHSTNPAYNNIVLHVVLVDEGSAVEMGGQLVPTLAVLANCDNNAAYLRDLIIKAQKLGGPLGSLSASDGPCCERVADRHPDLTALLAEVDKLGEQRMEARANQHEAACSQGEAGASLWAGLLEALGYSQNKAAFKKLAKCLPLNLILELDNEARHNREAAAERVINMEAALFGIAGLLPSQRRNTSITDPNDEPNDWEGSRYLDELERRWQILHRYLSAAGDGEMMQQREWNLARVRPANHPARRIAGLARWLVDMSPMDEPDLLENIIEIVRSESSEKVNHRLNECFKVKLGEAGDDSSAFWARRYDLLEEAQLPLNATPPDLIGVDRAADIVVNIVLPFVVGYARANDDSELAERGVAAYRQHPCLEGNELLTSVARQVFGYWLTGAGKETTKDAKGRPLTVGRLVTTARRQQGLIQLHHSFCQMQDWAGCPLA